MMLPRDIIISISELFFLTIKDARYVAYWAQRHDFVKTFESKVGEKGNTCLMLKWIPVHIFLHPTLVFYVVSLCWTRPIRKLTTLVFIPWAFIGNLYLQAQYYPSNSILRHGHINTRNRIVTLRWILHTRLPVQAVAPQIMMKYTVLIY